MNRILPVLLALVVLAGCQKPAAEAPTPEASSPVASSGVQEVQLTVTDAGFQPAEVQVAKDRPIRLTVTRKTAQTCATEIVFKEIDVKHDLPLDQAVTIDLPAQPSGTLNYACGMDMIKGSLVVQ
jgi:plastocyanin domain-containing protein